MSVLSQRLNEKIVVPGFGATVQVLGVEASTVRLGIQAPSEPPADSADRDQLVRLVENRLRIAGIGLNQLHALLQDAGGDDALLIVENLAEDLQLLRRRLGGKADRTAPPAPAHGFRKALVVEDNANERELLAQFLRLGGFDVDTAGDGADALDYLRARGKPDVVLLDMGMPRCDGPTTVRAIRRDGALAGLKIVGVSGRTAEECGLDRGPGGIDHWFRKPVDPSTLIRDLVRELSSPRSS